MGTKMEENMGQKTNQEQVAIKRTKSNGRKEYDLYADTLCWNCKRCTNPDSHPCPWAEKGEPIEGWTSPQRVTIKYPPPLTQHPIGDGTKPTPGGGNKKEIKSI